MLTNTEKNLNFGLTLTDFEAMTESLQLGDEKLFETLFLSRFEACMGVLKHKYNAPHHEAYDAVMWAMLRMRQLLMENKVVYGNLEAYLMRMAVNKYLKDQERNREYPTEFLPEGMLDGAEEVEPETLEILERAWAAMGDKCREILKAFYYDKIELKKLTQIMGDSSEANTRKRKERCLNELRKLFFNLYA